MTKILFVANVAKEHILKFHVPTIRMLAEKGWSVDVACSGNEKVPYCKNQYKMPYNRNPFSFGTIKGIIDLRKIINKEKYDIIYCHTPVGGLVARIAASLAQKSYSKIIYFVHGYHFFKGASAVNWLIFYPIEKILSSFTDAIITINEEDFKVTKEKFKKCKPFFLNGIGVDIKKYNVDKKNEIKKKYREELNIPADAIVLIYLAELSKNKNQIMLIKTLKTVLEKQKNVYLVLAGVDHFKGEIEKQASELEILKNVRILGWRDDAPSLYAMADICTASSLREGLPLNIIEAMASDVPIVATNNRGHASIIKNGENGFLVKVNDIEMMATVVLKLINDTVLRNKIVECSQKSLNKYDEKRILLELNTIFNKYL